MLPKRLGLRTLTWIDIWIGSTEPENIHLPPFVAKTRNRLAVDVGANNGVTTEIMASNFQRVQAFELNPRLLKSLEGALPENVTLWKMGLSSRQGQALLSVPVSKGVVLEGWGSVETPLVEKCEGMVTSKVEVNTLDSFHFVDVDFIKIDVEGHELEVLKGGVETITRCRPWIVVESLGESQLGVRALLEGLSYSETSLEELCGKRGRAHNMVFCPNAGGESRNDAQRL